MCTIKFLRPPSLLDQFSSSLDSIWAPEMCITDMLRPLLDQFPFWFGKSGHRHVRYHMFKPVFLVWTESAGRLGNKT